jgi:hypothetical protein
MDEHEQQQQAAQSKGNRENACNSSSPREETSTAGKATVSGHDPSHEKGSLTIGGYSM